MTKSLFSLLVFATLIFSSCKKELVPQDSAENPIAKTEDSIAAPTETANVQPTQTKVQPTQVSTPVPTKTLAGMNPPHGQAGHDCAIAVGAPLNSKKSTPAAQTPTTITTTQTNTTSTPAILNPGVQTVTAPGMNPPHGQTGHDCAVAVGAPLPKS